MSMNTNSNTGFCYLLFDLTTRCVLYKTDSSGAAMAVLLSTSNLGSMSCDRRWLALKNFDESNFNDFSVFHTLTFKNKVRHIGYLSEYFITPELKKLREEIMIRVAYHDILINKTNGLINLSAEHYGIIDFGDTIVYELQKCRPEENYYSDAVKNYALGSEIDDQAAFDELKTHMDNISHQRMRSMGLYIKYRNMLNQAPATQKDQQRVIDRALDALFFNSNC